MFLIMFRQQEETTTVDVVNGREKVVRQCSAAAILSALAAFIVGSKGTSDQLSLAANTRMGASVYSMNVALWEKKLFGVVYDDLQLVAFR
ncbi:hypothetical protein ASD02_18855 [Ensifer sp. Root1252]|nr:hypothetical protein ASD02_18855 [Ensifer sp. Root1252]KRC78680.1 hypothetical protein ASE32_26825 [Ensifer sp. Root231]KRD02583.1 hypothetical protein ASE47_19915 [Ensifer sp. Root258]